MNKPTIILGAGTEHLTDEEKERLIEEIMDFAAAQFAKGEMQGSGTLVFDEDNNLLEALPGTSAADMDPWDKIWMEEEMENTFGTPRTYH